MCDRTVVACTERSELCMFSEVSIFSIFNVCVLSVCYVRKSKHVSGQHIPSGAYLYFVNRELCLNNADITQVHVAQEAGMVWHHVPQPPASCVFAHILCSISIRLNAAP